MVISNKVSPAKVRLIFVNDEKRSVRSECIGRKIKPFIS
uniref:Transcriptional regulator n=1 Tax=Ascaris lumbricoides TaxID=6252 RepID=A0A0M3HHN0_ASCLU